MNAHKSRQLIRTLFLTIIISEEKESERECVSVWVSKRQTILNYKEIATCLAESKNAGY